MTTTYEFSRTPLETHTLTYRSLVDPTPGTRMGPGIDGRMWEVVGTIQDAGGSSSVVVQEVSR